MGIAIGNICGTWWRVYLTTLKKSIDITANLAISCSRVKSNRATKQITDKKNTLKKDWSKYRQKIGIKNMPLSYNYIFRNNDIILILPQKSNFYE
jgi:hypothetical protein